MYFLNDGIFINAFYKWLPFLSRNLYCIYTFSLHSKNKTDSPGKPGKPNKTNKTNKSDKTILPNKPVKSDITNKPNIPGKPDISDIPEIPVLPGAVSVDRRRHPSSCGNRWQSSSIVLRRFGNGSVNKPAYSIIVN